MVLDTCIKAFRYLYIFISSYLVRHTFGIQAVKYIMGWLSTGIIKNSVPIYSNYLLNNFYIGHITSAFYYSEVKGIVKKILVMKFVCFYYSSKWRILLLNMEY